MLLPTQSAWQESSASRRLSGDPIPISKKVVEAAQRRNTFSPGMNSRQREDRQLNLHFCLGSSGLSVCRVCSAHGHFRKT